MNGVAAPAGWSASCRLYRALVVELPVGVSNPNEIACIEADRSAIVAEWNSGARPDIKSVKRQKLTYVEYALFAYCTIYLNCL